MRPDPEYAPSGCGTCGHSARMHRTVAWHPFATPTAAQIRGRMLNRRALRADPDMQWSPPAGAVALGHDKLVPCWAPRWLPPYRWYCHGCGKYALRSGGTEYGTAAHGPCTPKGNV